MKKRFLAAFLALALCLGLCAVPSFAGNVTFVEDDYLLEYDGPGGDVVIPDGVTGIGSFAFFGRADVTSVTIPNGVSFIGMNAFKNCTALTTVNFPASVKTIEDYAFENTPWLKAQGDFAIVNGILLAYQGPGGNVTIPGSVTTIGVRAFEQCEGLTGVTIPDSVTTIGGKAFEGCRGLAGVTIPSSVTIIEARAFAGCESLTSVTIPNSVTTLEYETFENCRSLTSVALPSGITEIEIELFRGCEKLTSVTIPNGVTTISSTAFGNCKSLTSVNIPSSVTSIGYAAFAGCESLTDVTVPSGVTYFGGIAFSGTPWLKAQGDFPVVNGFLLDYQGPGGVIVLPSGLTGICDYVLSGQKGVTSVVIPDGTTSIGHHMFSFNPNLTSVTIPVSVTKIGERAFFDCTGLTDVYYGGTEAQWKAIDIYDEGYVENTFLLNATIHFKSADPDPVTPVDPDPVTPVDPDPVTPTPPEPVVITFDDVPAQIWYYTAVNWAVENKITNGTSDTRFSPLRDCTHKEILTFLYRAARGEGAATADDMDKAVSWAREKGMIGADFNSSAKCTRADAVNYIWQAFDKEGAAASSFNDVPANAAYAAAVNWAVANGVTDGTGNGNFTPDKVCNRGTIVTFLQRAYASASD